MKKNNRYCRGCIYHGKVSGDTCCDYILVAQRRRPCKAGEGCTVRAIGKKDGKKLFEEAEI